MRVREARVDRERRHVAPAAVARQADETPAGIGRHLPGIEVAADLDGAERRDTAAPQQRGAEPDPERAHSRILPQPPSRLRAVAECYGILSATKANAIEGSQAMAERADLVIYGMEGSPLVRKVQVLLAEINPAKRIPVLRDRSVGAEGVLGTIPDSSAICAYLERKHPEPALYPKDAFA
jgi:hypothetical protein